MAEPRVVVVGAGPAGVRAAETLVAAGLRPIVIEEGPRDGGQIYRRQPDNFHRPYVSLYGSESGRALDLHRCFESLLERIDFRPETLAWSVWEKSLHVCTRGRTEAIEFDALIVAAGAVDRLMPALSEILVAEGLDRQIEFEPHATRLVASGKLPASKSEQWEAARRRINDRFGTVFDLQDKVSLATGKTPTPVVYRARRIDLPISSISSGGVRYITMKDGKKYFEGGRLSTGHVVKSIQRNRVVLTKSGSQFVYLTGGE